MHLLSYLANGKARFGASISGGVVDLTERTGFADLRALIAGNGLDIARKAIEGQKPDHAIADITLLPPIPHPEKLWCIGVNYRDRNAEYKDNSDLPKYPSLFVRNPSSVVGSGQPIEKPRVSDQLDYEGELVIVIGKEGRHIPRERAFEHIFGMTLCNEGSVRDWLHHGKFNVTQGKNFDRSGSIGPWIVTSDECDPRGPHDIITRVNGEERQNDSTERLPLHLRHAEARRHDRDGNADRRRRPLHAAALAQGRRRRRGGVVKDRHPPQHRRGGAVGDAGSGDRRTSGATSR
jgi:2-keto-4-pentenoate hydratase/2-oxohepta-3-ene-1,7-dioic acid hydratase in catechol pathway